MRLKKHVGKDGRTYWYLLPTGGKGGPCKRLGPMAAERAEQLRMEAEAAAGEPVRRVRVTMAGLLDGFLKSRRAAGCTDETVEGYRYVLAPFLQAHTGRPVRALCRSDVEAWVTAHPGWSARQIAKFRTACGTLIGWAKDCGHEVPDFVAGFHGPRVRRAKRAAISLDQLLALLAPLEGDPREVPIGLAGFGGVPRGDLSRLTWEQVDRKAGVLRYTRGKTGQEATVPLVAPLFAILDRHRATHGPIVRVLTRKGTPLKKRALSRMLNDAFVAAKVPRPPGQSWHLLRRSTGTILANLGVPPHTIGAVLGHARGSPMPGLYTIADLDGVKAAGAKVDAAVAKTATS